MKKHKVLKCFLSFALIAAWIPQTNLVYGQRGDPENLALNKTYAASITESDGTTTLSADKAFDGITNREESAFSRTSRWGTPQLNGTQQPWISVDLGSPQTFQSFVIEWEKPNITSFQIKVKEDATWSTIYTKTGSEPIPNVQQVLHLDAPITAQNIKLEITGYEDAAPGWKSVSIYEFQIYKNNVPDAVLNKENIALKKPASASMVETSGATTLSADKAFDGVINRDEIDFSKQSRWGTPQLNGTQQPWLQVDLGSIQYLRSFVIDWEKANITAYQIQVSNDTSTWNTVYTKDGKDPIENPTQRIQLDTATYGRYVRLHATQYIDSGPGWKSVSVFELSVYQTTLDSVQPEAPTLGSVVNGIRAPIVAKGDQKIAMPSVPNGFTIQLHGSDYEQIIDTNGTIYQPLVTSNVQVAFRVSDGEHTQNTKDLTVSVPGSIETPNTDNKPTVIPELREWSGQPGAFTIQETSKIVVNPADATALSQSMEEFQKDYQAITGKPITITNGTTPSAHDFYFTLQTNDVGLKEEGYRINICATGVSVEAMHTKGIYWSTRTILQILKQTTTTIPYGSTRDYPKYKVRGFMFDVGRLPFSLDFLKEITKNMAWYKLNDFQVHLNDNYIWIEEYENPLKDAYSGFRLESTIIGENGVALTSEDMSYSKKDFRDFIQSSRTLGINIVPEIDTPAHSLSLTKVRPDLVMKDTSVARRFDHLDLNTKYNESLAFVKQIFNEYVTAQDPVFDKQTIVNIGTDEYDGNYREQFRKFTDDMLKFIQDDGRNVRLWGTLTARNGTTPVRHKDVQMNIWNTGWANPAAMIKKGYEIINMDDAKLYMVPSGDNSRGGYRDRLQVHSLYNSWKPNVIGGTIVSPTEPKMLGASYAMWNDNTDKRKKGLSNVDFFDRFFEPLPALSEKMWGEARDKNYAQLTEVASKTGTAPNTNPYYKVPSKTDTILDYNFDKDPIRDASGNGYDVTSKENVSIEVGKQGNALKLNGKNSYIETPVHNIGPTSTLTFSMKKDATTSNDKQVLFESSHGTIEIQKDSGKLGFSRLGNTFAFNYVVPENKWVNIELRALTQATDLYVDGKLVDSISLHSNTTKLVGTLIVPLQRIGSKTNAFKGSIDTLQIKKGAEVYIDPFEIPSKNFTIQANNMEQDHGSEGPIKYAFDNQPSTIWHTQYTPNQKPVNSEHPALIDIDMGSVYSIDKLTYLPRQDSATNGTITNYQLYGKKSQNDEMKLLSSGTLPNNKELKEFTWSATNIRYLQIKVLGGTGDFASAAEFKVYKADNKQTALQHKLDEVKAMDTSLYTTSTVQVLTSAIQQAEAILNEDPLLDDTIQIALDALNAATDALQRRANTEDATALLASIANQNLNENDYTAESWQAFIYAKTKVEEAIIDVSDITETQLKTMVEKLQHAHANLIKNTVDVDKNNLNATIKQAENIRNDAGSYEQNKAWATMLDALASGKAIAASTTASQKDVDDANLALQQAIASLTKKPTKPNKIPSIHDTEHGIDVYGEFDQGTSLLVKPINLLALANKIQDKQYLSYVTLEKAFDINIIKDGITILPNGEVEVFMHLDLALSKKQLAIVSVDANGILKNMPSRVEGNKIIFKTTHFSTYAIVSFTGVEPTITPHDNTVSTSDQTNNSIFILLMLVSGIGAFIIINKRKKSKQTT